MLPNHFRSQDEIDGIDRQVYEIRTEDGYQVVRLHGEPIARIKASEPITAKSDSWQIAQEVCAEAELPAILWCEHDKDVIFVGFSEASMPA